MAPPHTMCPSKRSRPGPITKSAGDRSTIMARFSKSSLFQPVAIATPETGPENPIIEQFRVLQGKRSDDSQIDEIRRRISYTKKQKLAAVGYALNTWKTIADGSRELISKYKAAANLGITTAMLRDWIKSQSTIETMSRGVRKNRISSVGQQPVLEGKSRGNVH